MVLCLDTVPGATGAPRLSTHTSATSVCTYGQSRSYLSYQMVSMMFGIRTWDPAVFAAVAVLRA
jgi:hypothetical protein